MQILVRQRFQLPSPNQRLLLEQSFPTLLQIVMVLQLVLSRFLLLAEHLLILSTLVLERKLRERSLD